MTTLSLFVLIGTIMMMVRLWNWMLDYATPELKSMWHSLMCSIVTLYTILKFKRGR